ncbi:dihydrofolate reductase family protein [Parapedobacter indicus]|uniref:Dihydrofolate reductase n=1 Tax=Parapedobacter indicus TaxID=1477437 RepID=A0A1I3UG10_9SPHI|nr:dihydrofolate reductase family protein [Parapedobacter indicus]PPK99290.1 dihydrofolate reductase [Parapedobacter indicus]SFJ81960.1 dihydrofolate reductase [Parapedobacter indicus]
MGKLIAAINMTLDGFCDHTYGIADDELHEHYSDLLSSTGTILYGRITYQLMEYWPPIVKNPTGNRAIDEFAVIMDSVPKIVFSRTLKKVDWESARIATRSFEEEVLALKQQSDQDILIGSPSLIAAATELKLVNEFQLCVHPMIAGKGLPLFKNSSDMTFLKLIKTETFGSGAIVLYYEPAKHTAGSV